MPVPYMQELFSAMDADGRVRPSVLYLESAAPDTYWGDRPLAPFEEVLPGRWLGIAGGRVHYNSGISSILRGQDADAYVVAGYSGLTNQIAMRWLRRNRRPWILQAEYSGMRKRRGPARLLREFARRPAVRWPAGIAAVGSRAAEAYRVLARRDCVVRNLPYFTDLEPFRRARASLPSATTAAVERPITFLYCGQLIERKGVDVLIQAFAQLADGYPAARLRLVGQGPLEGRLLDGLPTEVAARIELAGFRQPVQLPEEFARGDIFILPSRHDGWGVVVNQAIGAGLPIIASSAVGAAADLVQDYGNGRVVAPGEVAPLREAMQWLLEDPERIAQASRASRERAESVSLTTGVEAWCELLGEVVAVRGRGKV